MLKIPTTIPEKGFYYHYKHDPKGEVNNYAYEVMGVGSHTEEDETHGHFWNKNYFLKVYKNYR